MNSDFKNEKGKISNAIKYACDRGFGVLDSGFLCQSVSILSPKKPVCVRETMLLGDVLKQLKKEKIGCVLVVDSSEKLVGIFSERDCVLKIMDDYQSNIGKPISEFMTKDPVSESFQATIAFVLNLMSSGGFRHVPIVDSDNIPVGIISVKDVVDYIVSTFMEDILNLETIS